MKQIARLLILPLLFSQMSFAEEPPPVTSLPRHVSKAPPHTYDSKRVAGLVIAGVISIAAITAVIIVGQNHRHHHHHGHHH